jgi:hypothetical protein
VLYVSIRPWFNPLNNTWWSIQVIELLIMHSSPASLLRPNILLSTLFSDTLKLCSFHNTRDQVSHPNITTGKIMVPYILIFKEIGGRNILNWMVPSFLLISSRIQFYLLLSFPTVRTLSFILVTRYNSALRFVCIHF